MCREDLISELGMFTWAVETHSNLKTKKREKLPNRYDRFMQRYLRKKGNANVTPCNKKHARGNVYVVCSTSNSSKHRKSNDLPLVLALHLGWPFQSLDNPSHREILKASKWKCRKKRNTIHKSTWLSATLSAKLAAWQDSARDLSTQRTYTAVPDLLVVFSNMAVARGGRISLSPCKFAILGGGISGLAAAYHLLDKVTDPSNITVLESSGRAGGWMQSWTGENGTVFELGPRSIRPVGKAGRATLKIVRSTFYWKII